MEKSHPSKNIEISSDEARSLLSQVEELSDTAQRRGAYSRQFSLLLSLWTAMLVGTVGLIWWIPLFVGGLVWFHMWRKNQSTWIQEVQTRLQMIWVILLGLFCGCLFIGSYISRFHFESELAPWYFGGGAGFLILGLTELAYGKLRQLHPGK